MSKKFFWLKLEDDFFGDLKVKKLRKIAGGDTYTIIYLKLMLLSIKQEGKLFYQGIDDDISDELALIMEEDPENVRITLDYLIRVGLAEWVNETELQMVDVPLMIGSETDKAALMRNKREKDRQRAIEKIQENGNNVTTALPEVTHDGNNVTTVLPEVTSELPSVTEEGNIVKNCYTDIDIDIENINNKYIGQISEEKKEDKSAEQVQHLHAIEKKLIDLYHEKCPSLPKVKWITDKRKRKIRKMFSKYSLETFARAFEIAERSSFLKGECNNQSHPNFKADFDFFLDENKLISTLEGKYSGSAKCISHNFMESGTDYSALEQFEESHQLKKAAGGDMDGS